MDAMRLKQTEGVLCDAFLLKVFMGALLLICTLISFNLYAGDNCVDCGLSSTNIERAMVGGVGNLSRAVASGRKIKDDSSICGALMENDFKKLQSNLKKEYNTNLKNSYFDIECQGGDLLNLIIQSPRQRFMSAYHLQKYFEKTEKVPRMFSQILLHKVDGRNAIKRIEFELYYVRKTAGLRGGEMEQSLIKLRKKYLSYLKKYPVSGSAEALNSQQKP